MIWELKVNVNNPEFELKLTTILVLLESMILIKINIMSWKVGKPFEVYE